MTKRILGLAAMFLVLGTSVALAVYSGGEVPVDYEIVPEFSTLAASVALAGAGIGYFTLRKKL